MWGTYGLTVTITDPFGLKTTSTVTVAVEQTLTSISNTGQPPVATALDQFGNPLASQPVFDPGSDTITGPLTLDSGLTLLPAAGSQLTISGGITGAGGLTVGAPGTVVLSGVNGYTGGTTVALGTLVVSKASAIPASTSLTVGAGGVFIFDPSFVVSSAAVAAATTPAFASPVEMATTSNFLSSVSSAAPAATVSIACATTAAPLTSNTIFRNPAAADVTTFGRIDGNPHLPTAGSAVLPGRQSVSAGTLDTLPADQVVRRSIAGPIVVDLSWLGATVGGCAGSDQQKKDIALQALETVFAQYGRA